MPKKMKILGIHDGHNSGATLLEDGKIITSISEERLSRLKNDAGYPFKAIETILEVGKTKPDELDLIALATKFMHERDFYLNWEWYKKGYKEQLKEAKLSQSKKKYFLKKRIKERKKEICSHLKIPEKKIEIVEHHTAHAATAYFGSPWVNTKEKVLIFTLDGSGDGICATVNIGQNGKIKRIAKTKSSASLGKIYSRVTFLLGMKPWEHEYKVMGLAPYADKNGVKKSYEILKRLVKVDGLRFKKGTKLSTNFCYFYLKENLENHRFDWIAGAIQKLVEELVVQWIKNGISKTKINKIALSGGVFMNVKLNLLISEIPEVKDLFIFPSCGDESLSIGAGYFLFSKYLPKNKIPLLGPIYFGPEFLDFEIKKNLSEFEAFKKYKISFKKDIEKEIAKLLAQGKIVARFKGRMEWGARALGNRSILADPRNKEKIRELNEAIKHRDFWMPFCPTILKERAKDYIVNPKNIPAPYMILAFRTTKKGQKDLAAAIHPYDFTTRPQILEKKWNPEYYNLIKQFEKLTGVGAVLNTSFNLHGEPIVCTPKDALSTFERSGLKYLALGNYLIEK